MNRRHMILGGLSVLIGMTLGSSTIIYAQRIAQSGFDPNVGAGTGRPSYEGPYREFYKRNVRRPDIRDSALQNVPAVIEYRRSLAVPEPVEEVHEAAPERLSIVCSIVLDLVSRVRSDIANIVPEASQEAVHTALDRALIEYCL